MHHESFFTEATLIEIGVYRHKVELKSLYFSLVYVFLFSAKTRIHKQNTRTYTQSGAENSLFQFCLTITELLSPFYLEEMKNASS